MYNMEATPTGSYTMRKRPTRRPARIPEPRDLSMPPEGYQPSKADQEEEIDMPGMSDQRLRETFLRPFRHIRETKP